MSNGARHIIGFVVGLVATLVLAAGLVFGVDRMDRHSARIMEHGDELTGYGVTALLVFAAVAVLVGLLVATRISPVASLIPGIVFTAYGVLWTVQQDWVYRMVDKRDWLSDDIIGPALRVADYNLSLLLGLVLVAASAMPSRWRVLRAAPLEGPAAWQPPTPRPDVEGGSPAWQQPSPRPDAQAGNPSWQPSPQGGWSLPGSDEPTQRTSQPAQRAPQQGGWQPPPRPEEPDWRPSR